MSEIFDALAAVYVANRTTRLVHSPITLLVVLAMVAAVHLALTLAMLALYAAAVVVGIG